jgi:hypothetical protein
MRECKIIEKVDGGMQDNRKSLTFSRKFCSMEFFRWLESELRFLQKEQKVTDTKVE